MRRARKRYALTIPPESLSASLAALLDAHIPLEQDQLPDPSPSTVPIAQRQRDVS